MRAALSSAHSAVSADVDGAVPAERDLRLLGVAWRESAGTPAAAAFNIVHGATVAGGVAVLPVEVAQDTSDAKWFGDAGIHVPNGISIDRIAGELDIVLYYKSGV